MKHSSVIITVEFEQNFVERQQDIFLVITTDSKHDLNFEWVKAAANYTSNQLSISWAQNLTKKDSSVAGCLLQVQELVGSIPSCVSNVLFSHTVMKIEFIRNEE